MQTTRPVYRSKWGFHPVDRETYFKIRKLRYEWFKQLRKAACQRRWEAKENPKGDRPTLVSWFEAKSWNDRHGRNPIQHAWIDHLYHWVKPPRHTPEEIESKKFRIGRNEVNLEEALKVIDELLANY